MKIIIKINKKERRFIMMRFELLVCLTGFALGPLGYKNKNRIELFLLHVFLLTLCEIGELKASTKSKLDFKRKRFLHLADVMRSSRAGEHDVGV
jgi:hypothetical protein